MPNRTISTSLPTDPVVAQAVINNQTEQQKRELGFLGKMFGSAENAPTNIIGCLSMLFIIIGCIILFIPQGQLSFTASQYWDKIIPAISILIGYLFGVKVKR